MTIDIISIYILLAGKDVDVKELRIPGVLQRIAVVYLVVGLLQTAFAKSEDIHTVRQPQSSTIIHCYNTHFNHTEM